MCNFYIVRAAGHRAFRAEYAYLSCPRVASDHFGGWADNAENAAGWVEACKISLLDGSKRACRCGVASEDDERATLPEEPLHALQCVAIDSFKGAGTVGRTGIVAEVEVIVLRQSCGNGAEDGKTAVAGIEDADGGRGSGLQFVVCSLGGCKLGRRRSQKQARVMWRK